MIRISSSSTKLVSAVGVLERHRAVDVEEAAAVGPQLLDRLLRGDRAEGEGLGAAGDRVEGLGAVEGLDHALGDEDERGEEGDRQQDVEADPDQVRPEVAQRRARLRREAADHRGERRDPDRGGDEVLHRQPGHLGEVGERRLAAVVLPVGVGDEGGGGVEAEVPGARAEALGVERLDALGAQDQVERQPGEQAEDDDRAGVGLPVLPVVGPHAQHPVGEALDWPDDGSQEDPFALEDLGDVAAEQRHQRGEDDQEDDDLEPALRHQSFSPRNSA